jgi:hypothetical protein
MMSPALLFIWIPVITLAAILLPGTLLLGVAVGIGEASRQRPVVRPRAEQLAPPVLPELPRKAA